MSGTSPINKGDDDEQDGVYVYVRHHPKARATGGEKGMDGMEGYTGGCWNVRCPWLDAVRASTFFSPQSTGSGRRGCTRHICISAFLLFNFLFKKYFWHPCAQTSCDMDGFSREV